MPIGLDIEIDDASVIVLGCLGGSIRKRVHRRPLRYLDDSSGLLLFLQW